MAIYRKGSDPVALRACARRLDLCATSATEVCDSAGRAVATLRSSWSGGDLDQLMGRWPATEHQLRAVHDTITSLSRSLTRQAGEQDDTSGPSTTGSTSSSGSATNGAPPPGDGGDGSEDPAPTPPPAPPPAPPPYVPPGPLDQAHVDDAERAIDAVLDGPGFWDLNGNHDDLDTAAARLAELTPAEADALLRQLSPEQLAAFAARMQDEGGLLWVENGYGSFDRAAVTSNLLAQVSPEMAAKLQAAMPWSQPGFDTTDVALAGSQSQDGDQRSELHYGQPTGTLGVDTLSAQDINQGSFSDCWAIAAMTATAQADPEFMADNISVNDNGTVNVRLFDHDGNPRLVTVTSDLPLDGDGNPIGAHGTDGQLWPAYYEKAFAVVYAEDAGGVPDGQSGRPYDVAEQGTYGAVEWDYNDNAPGYVTGSQPTGVSDFDGAVAAFNNEAGVIVSTPATAPSDAPAGYVTRHVYYVQSVNADGSITLGNPWGPDSPSITVDESDFNTYFTNPQAMQPRT